MGTIMWFFFLFTVPGKTDSYSYSSSTSGSSGAIIGAGIGGLVVFAILIGSLIACKIAQQRRLAVPRTPYMVVQTNPGMTFIIWFLYLKKIKKIWYTLYNIWFFF